MTNPDTTPPLGCHDGYHGLTQRQVRALLTFIEPHRILDSGGQDHVAAWDVIAWLTKVFGFTGWDKEIIDLTEVYRGTGQNNRGREVPAITYRAQVRLTIKCLHGVPIKKVEDVGTGTSPNLPNIGDAVDFAAKNAVSYAVKRCAKDLGDQFGLSLYNNGSRGPVIGWTLQVPLAEPQPSAEVTSLGEREDSPTPEGQETPEVTPQAPQAAPSAPQQPTQQDYDRIPSESTAAPEPRAAVNPQEWGRGATPGKVNVVERMVAQATSADGLNQAVAAARRYNYSPEQAGVLLAKIQARRAEINSGGPDLTDHPPGYSGALQEAGYGGDG